MQHSDPATQLDYNLECALERFKIAQRENFSDALGEIIAGEKRSHWMWYVFPQLRGLGQSEVSQYYGIWHLPEAAHFYRDDLLGARYRMCVDILNDLGYRKPGLDVMDVFGPIDAAKLRSSLTLFAFVEPGHVALWESLNRWFQGQMCSETVRALLIDGDLQLLERR